MGGAIHDFSLRGAVVSCLARSSCRMHHIMWFGCRLAVALESCRKLIFDPRRQMTLKTWPDVEMSSKVPSTLRRTRAGLSTFNTQLLGGIFTLPKLLQGSLNHGGRIWGNTAESVRNAAVGSTHLVIRKTGVHLEGLYGTKAQKCRVLVVWTHMFLRSKLRH